MNRISPKQTNIRIFYKQTSQ